MRKEFESLKRDDGVRKSFNTIIASQSKKWLDESGVDEE
jgi:hypothetical protein